MAISEGRAKEIVVDSRISKVLSMRTDSTTMIESFDAISSFFIENTVEARRSLRQDLELQNLSLAKQFLEEFNVVYQQIESIQESSNKLEDACQQLALRVSNADENMKSFMKKASELNSTRTFYLKQSEEISLFLGRFQLSKEEMDALYSVSIDDPMSYRSFFNAFQRLKLAYTDCKAMVENNNYSAGFELLDALGQHQDTAYRRLFEWVKLKCENLTEDFSSTHDIDVQLQYAIRCLRTLPMYFSQCQDLVVNSRRNQLVQKFIVALTQGGTSGQVFRAIDLHCHDPVRYVGDMLAWMHQAVVSEQEFLEAIFGENGNVDSPRDRSFQTSGKDNSHTTNDHSSESNDQSKSNTLMGLSVPELLVRCLQGLGRPLRVRITQTLESRTSLLAGNGSIEILYSLTDLLSFYERTFSKLIRLENAVHSTVKGSLLECQRCFLLLLNKQSELLAQPSSNTILDLSPSQFTKDCCHQLREIMKVHASAMSHIPSDTTDECYIDTVLGIIIQPLLQGCRLAGQSLGQADMAVFMLNNVSAIKNEISEGISRLPSSSPDKKNIAQWLELLKSETMAWLDVIVEEEAGKVLRRSDMDKLIELIDVLPSGLVASEQVGLIPDRVSTVMRAFYASLLTTTGPSFDRLIDIDLREVARQNTSRAIAEAHAKVYRLVSNEVHRYDPNILLHTDAEVRVLLQIEDSLSDSNHT